MQLEKSFYYKFYLKALILLLFVAFNLRNASAQVKVIDHKLAKKETLYKLSVLYRTEIDSIMHWNKLSSTRVSEGALIKILDYNKLKLEEFVYNQYVYDIEAKKAEKAQVQQRFNDKLSALEQRKTAINVSMPLAMQEFFEIAKIKKSCLDSLFLMFGKIDQEMESLYSEKAEIEEDIKMKYPQQYIDQGYATSLKVRENRLSFPNTEMQDVAFLAKEVELKGEDYLKENEELAKVSAQKDFEEQKQWERGEKARQDLLAKELKEQEKQSKKEAEANRKELAAWKEENEAKKAVEIKTKEEAAITLKNEQIKAIQEKDEMEAENAAIQEREVEKNRKELALANQMELDKLAKEKLGAQKEAEAEMSEDDFKISQMQKEFAAMEAVVKRVELISTPQETPSELSSAEALIIQKELDLIAMAEAKQRAKEADMAAKAKKQEELDQKEAKVHKEEAVVKQVALISTPQETPSELSSAEALVIQKELDLIAMADAKQQAKEANRAAKADKEETKWQEKLAKDSISKLPQKKPIEGDSGKDPDVLIFDVGFEADQDTSSKKYQKQQAKLSKEFQVEVDSSKVTRSFTVDEVVIKKSKKTGKFKMGDKVDAIGIDKSRFFLSRAIMEIDKGNYKKAIEYSDKSIDLNPNYTEAYMLKGDIMASFGYFDKAYNQYEKANTVDSRIPQLHYNMGNCLIYMGKKEKALEKMGEAISIDPNYILAYSGRSSLLIDMKEYASALNDYNTILEINKYFYPALKGRGLAYLNLGQYPEAIKDFNQLLEYDKEDPSIYYHRGIAKMYLSEIYGACMDFLTSSERGYLEANKAINKYCD
jgi:tetratricopeptide (TPR) repeat protein